MSRCRQLVDRTVVVDHEQLAAGSLAERDDRGCALEQKTLRPTAVPRERREDLAAAEIAVDVRAAQAGQIASAIDESSRDRAAAGIVRIFDDRRGQPCRRALLEAVRSL